MGYEFNGACEIHDKCYDTCGETKAICDLNFRDNMGKTCELKNKLAKQRMRRAQAYINKAKSYHWYRVIARDWYIGKAAWETAKAARAKAQYAACSTLKASYYSAVYLLGKGAYCEAQRAKKCCPLQSECSSYYTCPTPIPPKKHVLIGETTRQPVQVDNGKWCEYWVWEHPKPTPEDGDTFIPEGGGKPTPEHSGKPTPESGKTFIPEGSATRERTGKPTPEHGPPPTIYVKVKISVIENGKKTTKPLAGAQFKLSELVPDLPGGKKDDSGYNQSPRQATTGPDGNGVINGATTGKMGRASPLELSEPAWYVEMLNRLAGIREANASPTPFANERSIEIVLPSFDSYIVKINLNKRNKNWDKPATYIGAKNAAYVVHSWIAGNTMYAVVNVPELEAK